MGSIAGMGRVGARWWCWRVRRAMRFGRLWRRRSVFIGWRWGRRLSVRHRRMGRRGRKMSCRTSFDLCNKSILHCRFMDLTRCDCKQVPTIYLTFLPFCLPPFTSPIPFPRSTTFLQTTSRLYEFTYFPATYSTPNTSCASGTCITSRHA